MSFDIREERNAETDSKCDYKASETDPDYNNMGDAFNSCFDSIFSTSIADGVNKAKEENKTNKTKSQEPGVMQEGFNSCFDSIFGKEEESFEESRAEGQIEGNQKLDIDGEIMGALSIFDEAENNTYIPPEAPKIEPDELHKKGHTGKCNRYDKIREIIKRWHENTETAETDLNNFAPFILKRKLGRGTFNDCIAGTYTKDGTDAVLRTGLQKKEADIHKALNIGLPKRPKHHKFRFSEPLETIIEKGSTPQTKDIYIYPLYENQLKGETLKRLKGQIDYVKLAETIVDVMDYAANKGYLLADLKPEDFFYHKGDIVVTDSGPVDGYQTKIECTPKFLSYDYLDYIVENIKNKSTNKKFGKTELKRFAHKNAAEIILFMFMDEREKERITDNIEAHKNEYHRAYKNKKKYEMISYIAASINEKSEARSLECIENMLDRGYFRDEKEKKRMANVIYQNMTYDVHSP